MIAQNSIFFSSRPISPGCNFFPILYSKVPSIQWIYYHIFPRKKTHRPFPIKQFDMHAHTLGGWVFFVHVTRGRQWVPDTRWMTTRLVRCDKEEKSTLNITTTLYTERRKKKKNLQSWICAHATGSSYANASPYLPDSFCHMLLLGKSLENSSPWALFYSITTLVTTVGWARVPFGVRMDIGL